MKITVKGKRPYVAARDALHQVANMEKILNSTRKQLSERDAELEAFKNKAKARENVLIHEQREKAQWEKKHEGEIRALKEKYEKTISEMKKDFENGSQEQEQSMEAEFLEWKNKLNKERAVKNKYVLAYGTASLMFKSIYDFALEVEAIQDIDETVRAAVPRPDKIFRSKIGPKINLEDMVSNVIRDGAGFDDNFNVMVDMMKQIDLELPLCIDVTKDKEPMWQLI